MKPDDLCIGRALYEGMSRDPTVMVRRFLREDDLVGFGQHLLTHDFDSLVEECVNAYIAESRTKGVSMERVDTLRRGAAKAGPGKPGELAALRKQIDELDVEIYNLAETARGPLTEYLDTLTDHPDSKFVFEFAKAWATSAFPRAIVGHKLAASFMATGIEPHMVEHVVSPWSAWQATVPNGLITVVKDGVEEDVGRVLVLTSGNAWRVCAVTTTTQMWRRGPLEDLIGDDVDDSSVFAKAPDERDARAWTMLMRYVVGLCFELSDPHTMTVAVQQRERGERKREPGSPPSVWKFEVRRDVHVDVREAVRGFVLGTRKAAPSVQVLVRGHWKRQAFGPKMTQRKMIHIEPYWRGPEDAPIAVRGHKLETT